MKRKSSISGQRHGQKIATNRDTGENAYTRALAQFEALTMVPSLQIVRKPSGLARAANLSSTTGYRMAVQAEALGVLQRQSSGIYCRGPLLLRAGLSALGFGHLALAAAPILVDLRHSANLTAFLYVLSSDTLLIGPHSMGRSTEFVRPNQSYKIISSDAENHTFNKVSNIVGTGSDDTYRQNMIIQNGVAHAGNHCGIGLMLPRHIDKIFDQNLNGIHEALSLALKRVIDAGNEHIVEEENIDGA